MRKRLILFSVILIIVATLCVVLSSCDKPSDDEKVLKSLTVLSSHQGNYVYGEAVDLSEITLLAVFSDGENRNVTVDDSMLTEDERNKFFTPGVHSVYISYGGKQVVLQISVSAPIVDTTYNVRFFSNGGSEVAPLNTKTIQFFINSTRPNYTFDGWYATPDFSGSRAVAPYTLTGDTDFYAKWIDNRRCNVKFMDGDDVMYDFEVIYGTGIDINDLESFPAPEEKEGKVFAGWILVSGSDLDEITIDTVLEAGYESVKCTVQIEYWDGEKLVNTPSTLNYGETFDISGYTLPPKEGHTSRWVMYKSGSDVFEELPTDSDILTVTYSFSIKAHHEINTYSVTIYNGNAVQNEQNLKNGTLELYRVYSEIDANSDYKVNYNENFMFSNFIQEPYLKEPTSIYGYDAYWCYVISTATGEIWRNNRNQIWDDTAGAFVTAAGEEATSNFNLTDGEGNYLARIYNGDLMEVKGNIAVRAKYIKKNYTVRLLRRSGSDWQNIGTFTEKYLADFCLYDPTKYSDLNFATALDVESYYYLNNVAEWSSEVEDKWNSIYYTLDGYRDDWDVEWYVNSGMSESDRIDFNESNGVLGSYEITGDLTLYCKDIDLRRYDVLIYYDYDFGNASYRQSAEFPGIPENELLGNLDEFKYSILKSEIHNGAKYNYTYTFNGWYDYPYTPEGNGFTGNFYASLDNRTRNMVYYAHYTCETTYTLTIYDKTQMTAYDGTILDNMAYNVPENTITYIFNAGTKVNLDMIYKGRLNADDSVVRGQEYYEKVAFIEYVQKELQPKYQDIIENRGNGDLTQAMSNLNALIAEKEARINAYLSLLNKLYIYDYTDFGKNEFESDYMTMQEYNAMRYSLQDLINERDLLLEYDKNYTIAQQYIQANEDAAAQGGLYKKYSDSYRTLNEAYGFDIESDSVKYRFAGWYTDSTYSTPYDPNNRTMEFEWVASGGSLTLYAKWADEEKGSEGLVFKKITDANNQIIGLAVADFMNRSDYEAWGLGCGYNDFNNYDYSVNYNDQDVMPSTLGQNIEVQIPTSHGGTNAQGIPVIGILANAFSRHGVDMTTVTLPNSIQFIEEGAFINCDLRNISGTDGEYIQYVEERAVYQIRQFRSYDGSIDVSANTLIAYANRSVAESITLMQGTVRIADYALIGAVNLRYADLGNTLISIGKSAFENSVLTGSGGVSGELVLPDSLTSIGDYAFKNCVDIAEFKVGGNSKLATIGKDALSTTKWFVSKTGVIVINGYAVGLRGANYNSFDKDISGELITTKGKDGTDKYTVTNDFGVLFYDTETLQLKEIVVKSNVKGVTDYAFDPLTSNVSTVTTFTFEGALEGGLANYAFNNCVNVNDIYILNLSSVGKTSATAFYGCSRPKVHVGSAAIDESWSNCPNIKLIQDTTA